jgi:hypothetical protein
MTSREGPLARPEGEKRAKPGTKGEGELFLHCCTVEG